MYDATQKEEGERALVLRLVERKYGREVVERLDPVLDAIRNPAGVTAAGDAVVLCESADELLARVAAATPTQPA